MSTWVVMPSDDDIIHGHKYIDKIMGPNGKWRYIYYRAKKNVRNAIGLNQKKKLEIAEEGLQKAANKLKKSDSKNVQKDYDAAKQYKEKYDKRKEEFNDTLLGKIDSVKDKGLKIFDNIFGTNLSKDDLSKIDLKKTNERYIPEDTIKEKYLRSKAVIGADGFGGWDGRRGSKVPKTGTLSRGTAYSPSNVIKKQPGGRETQPSGNVKTSAATSFLRNSTNRRGGLVSLSKRNPGVAIGADVINKDKKQPGGRETQPSGNVKTSAATSFLRNSTNRRGGLVSLSKRNPGVAIGADVINKDKKKKRRRA